MRRGVTAATERPRVAVIYHFFPHYRGAVLRELAQSSLFDYRLFADTQDFVDQAIPGLGPGDGSPDVTRLPCRRLVGHTMWQSGLLRLALRGNYAAFILLGNVYWPATWLALVILRLRRKPAWLWTHGWVDHDRGAKRLVRNTFYRLATGLLLYGHFAKQHALTLGFPADRLQVIRNSLDLDAMSRAHDSCGKVTQREALASLFGENPNRAVICATRLIPERRLLSLVEALALLRSSGEDVHLILVGGGPQESLLRQRAAALGLSVHVEGPCYDEDRLAVLFKAASACVIPRNIGLLAISAMSHGCPVVTVDDWTIQFPEFEAVIPGVTGRLTAGDSPEELAGAIRDLFDELDGGGQMGDASRAMVRRFYSPSFQRSSIEWVLTGNDANDLFYLGD